MNAPPILSANQPMAAKNEHLGWMKKAESYIEWKQYKQAIAAFDKAIKAKPNYAPAWKAKSLLLEDRQDHAQSIECCQKWIKYDPEDSEAWVMYTNELQAIGDLPAAQAAYEQAFELFPDVPMLRVFGALFYKKQEQPDKAIALMNQAVDIGADPLILTIRSQILSQYDQLDAALADLDRIAHHGDFYMVSHARGEILEKMGRHDEALEAYTAAMYDAQAEFFLWEKKGLLLEKLERYDEAMAWYEMSMLAIGPDGMALKAQLLQRLKRYDEALVLFQQASERLPQNMSMHYDRAVCLIQCGDKPSAIAALTIAIDGAPEDFQFLLKTDPLFAAYLAEPEFQALLSDRQSNPSDE
jgi:tetratricopeptide (TPR) repeat protein